MNKLSNELLRKIEVADSYIKNIFSENEDEIGRAMAYSVLAGGKRIRPLLCMLACEALGGKGEDALPFAAAVEFIHCYSLIHDDLPAMDDDDFRRGKPSNHKVFGEAVAILAGDALLTEAFSLIANAPLDSDKRIKAVAALSKRAGREGMVLGQVLDMSGCEKYDDLLEIYRRKTSDLLNAALSMGAIAAGGCGNEFDEYAEKIGIAFQIKDDILDVTSSAEVLGKPINSDEKNEKKTSLKFMSIEKAREEVEKLTNEGKASLSFAGDNAEKLLEIADYLIYREY